MVECEHANRKIEFVTSDCFLLQNGQLLMLTVASVRRLSLSDELKMVDDGAYLYNLYNLNVDGIDLASECGSYPCPSLFAAMDGGMVCVLGQDDFGVLYIDILMIHSFVRVLRVEWENEGAGIEEWSSMYVSEHTLSHHVFSGREAIYIPI